jgi:hypothetical protein
MAVNSSELTNPGAQRFRGQLQEVAYDDRLNFNNGEARELDKLITKYQDIFMMKRTDTGTSCRV